MRRYCYTSAVFGALGMLMVLGSAQAQDPALALRYGKWGFDLTAVDPATRPGDDFFEHANGAWLARTEIPLNKTGITLRVRMTDATEARLHALLESAAERVGHEPDDLEGKVGAFYKAFMDEAAIEALGAKPLAPYLSAIRAATTYEALGAMMGRAAYDFPGAFFGAYIDVDAKDPNRYAIQLYQDGLGLPDRDNYLKTDPDTLEVKNAYQAYADRLLALIGWPDPAKNAEQIVKLETRIAEAHWSKAQAREVVATYNSMTVAELEALTPSFPWRAYLAQAKLGSPDRVIVAEKSAFSKIADVFAGTPVETLQAWLAFNVVDRAAPYLSKPFAAANFEMREKALLGRKEQQVRWKRGVFVVSGDLGGNGGPLGNMGWAVGELYVEKYFPPTVKTQFKILFTNLTAAFRARLERLDWMSATTKAEALRKLENILVKVGYPNKPRDYNHLVVLDNDLMGNMRRAAETDWDFYVNRLPDRVDRDEWRMTPQSNNAYTNFYLRDVVIPAGVLQPPMFDPGADPAINYGASVHISAMKLPTASTTKVVRLTPRGAFVTGGRAMMPRSSRRGRPNSVGSTLPSSRFQV